jgi:hypothetical protein
MCDLLWWVVGTSLRATLVDAYLSLPVVIPICHLQSSLYEAYTGSIGLGACKHSQAHSFPPTRVVGQWTLEPRRGPGTSSVDGPVGTAAAATWCWLHCCCAPESCRQGHRLIGPSLCWCMDFTKAWTISICSILFADASHTQIPLFLSMNMI